MYKLSAAERPKFVTNHNMASSDSLFFTLPKRTRRAIDDAFDLSINPSHVSGSRRSKRRKVSVEPISGGGGFLAEDTSTTSNQESSDIQRCKSEAEPTHLPLDFIPSALQHLDLPPDDDEILSILRNAASGWTSSSLEPLLTTDSHGKYVNRDDWRAVCAVLLENRSTEDDPAEGDSDAGDEYIEEYEEYDSDQEPPSIASDDEYMDHRFTSSSRRMRGGKSQTRRPLSLDELKTRSNTLTKRQRQTCLDTFCLFFPDVPVSEVAKRNIMIKDLQRVAKLLNEKLKADDVGAIPWISHYEQLTYLDAGNAGNVFFFTRQIHEL